MPTEREYQEWRKKKFGLTDERPAGLSESDLIKALESKPKEELIEHIIGQTDYHHWLLTGDNGSPGSAEELRGQLQDKTHPNLVAYIIYMRVLRDKLLQEQKTNDASPDSLTFGLGINSISWMDLVVVVLISLVLCLLITLIR